MTEQSGQSYRPSEWLIRVGEVEYRAESLETVRSWHREGRIPDVAYVYHPSLGAWKTMGELAIATPTSTTEPLVRKSRTGLLLAIILIPLLLVGACGALVALVGGSVGPKSWRIQRLESELKQVDEDLDRLSAKQAELSNKEVGFVVMGSIQEKDEDRVSVWGQALPLNQDLNHVGAVIEPGNIVVLQPHSDFMHSGVHFNNDQYRPLYFVEKSRGANAFGADVPVRIFTTKEPRALANVSGELTKLAHRRNAIVTELQELDPQPLNPAPTPPSK